MAIDIQPPILKSLVFPQIVDISNGTAPCKITVRADGTGSLIASVSLIFDRQLVGIYNYIVHPTQAPETFSFYWLPGSWSDDNWNDGEVSQTFGVKPSNENQTLNLLKVIVADREGNERTYLPLELVGISASTQFSVVGSLIDKTAPSISISSNLKTINSSQTATVTFALSEASTNFVATDVIVTGGILTNFNGSGAIYTAIFTPTTKSTANGVIRVASGDFTDAAGNLNTEGVRIFV
jgi:hypothetical protein